MDNKLIEVLPAEVAQIAENVSIEKRNEVQTVLNHVFNGVSKMREQLDSVAVVDENDKVNMKLANTIRLGVRQVRLDAEKTFDAKRSEVQQQMLSYKTEDQLWLKAKQTMQILTKEIEEQARWKEKTKQRFEAEQEELKTQQRMLQVSKFSPELLRSEFENMGDESFTLFLAGLEKQHNDKLEAERKAEEERIAKEKADAEAKAKMEAENKRLKDEAEAKEKQIQAERAEAEAKRKSLEEKAKQEKAAADAKLKAEIEAKEKLQAEIRAKSEAEEKAKKDAELKVADELKSKQKEEAEAAKAPIKQQLNNWVNSFSLGKPLSENETTIEIDEKFEAFRKWAKTKIEAL